MTDDEAREELEKRATWCEAMGSPGQLREMRALRHALQAIEDRAVLIHWHYDDESEVTEESVDEMAKAYETVRRHARGGE